ncbi:MAG TPA: lipopolysaccharide transport periplasmic protein LptA [Lysobacter sp.]|nr:lipopolysaccharide transport periplasmic protein LptA [Lysobacter sp.]
MNALPASLLALALAASAGPAFARSSDRNQPMDVDANHTNCAVGDDSGPCTFTGNVRIVQGTLRINAASADLRRGGGDIQKVFLSGAPVQMEQQLDNGQQVTANSSRVEYDLQSETVVFIGNATLSKPDGSLSGDRIVYNMANGQVQAGGGENSRVKVRFLPKNRGTKGG